MLKNTVTAYGSISKLFHWIMAALFLAMFSVAYIMINIPRSGFMFTLYDLHKATGLLLFMLVTMRLIWCLLNPHPRLPETVASWQRYSAKMNIALLYFLMFAMPLSGFLTSTLSGHDITFYNLFTISAFAHDQPVAHFFSQVHELLSYALIAVFLLHVLGVLYHHFVLKDEVAKRMWGRAQPHINPYS